MITKDEFEGMLSIKPVRSDVLLLVDAPKSMSTIIQVQEVNPETGLVIAVGPDCYDVVPGMTVWFSHGDPGIVMDGFVDRLRLVAQAVVQGEVIAQS